MYKNEWKKRQRTGVPSLFDCCMTDWKLHPFKVTKAHKLPLSMSQKGAMKDR